MPIQTNDKEFMEAVVYFDLDRVLCDFGKQAFIYNVLKTNSRVNWLKLLFFGQKFWSEMEWFPNAKNYFFKIKDLCKKYNIRVKVLSSVKFSSGRKGKIIWCRENLDISMENIILVNNPKKKKLYANKNSLLIDDNIKNIEDFRANGGQGIVLDEWNETVFSSIVTCMETKMAVI